MILTVWGMQTSIILLTFLLQLSLTATYEMLNTTMKDYGQDYLSGWLSGGAGEQKLKSKNRHWWSL